MNARVLAFALAAAMTTSPARAADAVSLFAAGSLRAALSDPGRIRTDCARSGWNSGGERVFAGRTHRPYHGDGACWRVTHMKIHTLAVALIMSVALAAPADAASKKRKKEIHRAPVSESYSYSHPHPHDVWFGGEYVGRDPDPNIRALMMRSPRMYDGAQ
jgi:hypothetical protein